MKKYQERAVAALISRAKELLRRSGNDKTLIFKSPTGSGKTLMMAEFLARLTRETVHPLAFIWAAPRYLHKQSYDKLARHYANSRALRCAYFRDLDDNQIKQNQILFLNWESINEEDAVIVRENEDEFYLSNVLENTRAAKRDIVLIVDESHFAAGSGISRRLVADVIRPKLAIGASATPTMQGSDDTLSVFLEDVKAEGMIKKSVVVNDGLGNMLSGKKIRGQKRADESVLQLALDQRRRLAEAFAAEGSAVNPLLCIQLPDFRIDQDKIIYDSAVEILAKNGITAENGKLAIRMDGDTINWEGISQNNDDAEALIFKHAIALGWDCPRAHILVLFRNWQSLVFSVQTLGRIMRMPEPNVGHYKNEMLNNGYVYTNISEVEIKEDVAGGFVRVYSSRRIDDYAPIKLPSVHRKEQRERTRLSPRFVSLFLEAAERYGLAREIDRKNQSVHTNFIADFEAAGVDALTGEKILGDVHVDVDNKADLQRLFDYFARDNLPPFYPENRSIYQMEEAIQEFFGGPLEMGVADHFSAIVKITLSESNKQHFVSVLTDAKNAYIAETEQRKEPLQPTREWEIPELINYGENYAERAAQKSVMQPFYVRATGEWKTEKSFIELMEKSAKVKWWYQNGEGESMYFAVPYKKDGEDAPFYVDFVVQFADGEIGLYDTKSGIVLRDAGAKSDGLLQYIAAQNKGGKNLRGGIVAPADSSDYSRGWKVYKGKGAKIAPPQESPDNWEWLQEF